MSAPYDPMRTFYTRNREPLTVAGAGLRPLAAVELERPLTHDHTAALDPSEQRDTAALTRNMSAHECVATFTGTPAPADGSFAPGTYAVSIGNDQATKAMFTIEPTPSPTATTQPDRTSKPATDQHPARHPGCRAGR